MLRHPVCPDRVERERAHTGSARLVRVHARGLRATCPACPRTLGTRMAILNVSVPEHVHHVPDAFFGAGIGVRINTIRHEFCCGRNSRALVPLFGYLRGRIFGIIPGFGAQAPSLFPVYTLDMLVKAGVSAPARIVPNGIGSEYVFLIATWPNKKMETDG